MPLLVLWVMIVTVEPAAWLACAAGEFVVELLADGVLVPQAATSAAAPATRGAAHHRLRIGHISVLVSHSASLP